MSSSNVVQYRIQLKIQKLQLYYRSNFKIQNEFAQMATCDLLYLRFGHQNSFESKCVQNKSCLEFQNL